MHASPHTQCARSTDGTAPGTPHREQDSTLYTPVVPARTPTRTKLADVRIDFATDSCPGGKYCGTVALLHVWDVTPAPVGKRYMPREWQFWRKVFTAACYASIMSKCPSHILSMLSRRCSMYLAGASGHFKLDIDIEPQTQFQYDRSEQVFKLRAQLSHRSSPSLALSSV